MTNTPYNGPHRVKKGIALDDSGKRNKEDYVVVYYVFDSIPRIPVWRRDVLRMVRRLSSRVYGSDICCICYYHWPFVIRGYDEQYRICRK